MTLLELSDLAKANGIILLISLILLSATGLIFIYKSKKLNIDLLMYSGLFFIIWGLGNIPQLYDFIIILINGAPSNIIPDEFLSIAKFIWTPFAFILGIYVGVELLIPKKKRYILIIYLTLGVVYEILLFIDPLEVVRRSNNFALISLSFRDNNVFSIQWTIFSIIHMIYVISFFVFNGLGFFYKAVQTSGLLKRRFMLISMGFLITSLFILITFFIQEIRQEFEWLTQYTSFCIVFTLLGFFLYFGLKPKKKAKTRKKKIPTKKQIQLASYLVGASSDIEVTSDLEDISKHLENPLIIFASYATKDEELFKVHKISKHLTKYSEIEKVVFWQEFLDDNIYEYMDENLGKCDVMLLFCSKNALGSVPVKKEWTAADAIGKPIIPVFFNPNHIPPLLKSRLGMEYDFYDLKKNVIELHDLILKKVVGLSE
ncbi:MAG: toll/interleukin-1 receptor domain-containing protein [Candidatus Thorarchaeota archaeon]